MNFAASLSSKIGKPIKVAVGAAMLAQSPGVIASIPPTIAVKVVSSDRGTQATSRAIVELLAAYDNFHWEESRISAPGVLHCFKTRGDAESCARQIVRQGPIVLRSPPVLIIARPAGVGRIGWTCIGAGEKPVRPGAQSITLDVGAIFAGPTARRQIAQRRALQCVWAAAAEAGGVVRVE